MQAVIRPRGASEMRVAIVDISRGGVSLHCDWRAGPGKDVPMELPGAGGPVTARVVRSEGGKLALAFRQDEAVLRRVDQAIALIATGTTAAA
jgi:PilZ domain